MIFTLFGYWVWGGGSPSGLVHNLLLQFCAMCSSKMEVCENYFFDTVITYNDHPRYVRHFLGSISVFLTLSGYYVCGGGGGSPSTLVYIPFLQFFAMCNSKIEVFVTYIFDTAFT